MNKYDKTHRSKEARRRTCVRQKWLYAIRYSSLLSEDVLDCENPNDMMLFDEDLIIHPEPGPKACPPMPTFRVPDDFEFPEGSGKRKRLEEVREKIMKRWKKSEQRAVRTHPTTMSATPLR